MADVIGIRITAQDDTQSALASVQRGLGQLNTAASSVNASLAGLGIGISAAGFVAFTQNIINGVDALNDIKDATGATIENISALEDVARRSGTGLDTVSTALVKMNQALSTAKPGSDTERAINALGLSVKNLKAQDPVVAFQSIAQALSGYADDANKARLVQELFGKSLKDVAPLLNDAAAAGKLVATVTTEQAEAAEKFNKQLFSIQKNVTDVGRSMVSELLPVLAESAERFALAYKHAGSFLGVLGMYARLDYSQGFKANLQSVEDQIAALEERAKRITSASVQASNDKAIASLRAQAQYIKDLQQSKALDNVGDTSDAVSRKYLTGKKTIGDVAAGGPDKASVAAANAELRMQQRLLNEIKGITDTFYAEWQGLTVMYKAGTIGLEQMQAAQLALWDRQPAAKQAAKDLADTQKEAAKQAQENAADYAKALEDQEKSAEKIRDQVDAERLHVQSIGATKEAVAELLAERLDEQAVTKERLADYLTENNISADLAQSYREQAQGLRELAKLKRQGAAKEVAQDLEKENKKAADKAAEDLRRAAERIQDSITDALMRGFESGKGFAENLRDTVVNMFKSMVLRPIVEIGVRGGLSALGLGGLSGAANAAGAVGDASAGLSMLSGMKGWLTDFGGGVASQVSKLGNYLTSFSSTTVQGWGEGLMNNATAIGEYAQTAGNALGYFNAALAASEGKWGKAIGTGIGTYFGGPIGAAIGGAIGGWVDEAFGGGHEYTTGTGISGRFSGSSFAGRNYQDWRNDGSSGFFGIGASGSSSGTNYSAMDATLQKSLGGAYGKLLTQTAGFATALGANAASIIGYQKDIKLSLGSDGEANKKAIAAMFEGIANEVAAVVLDKRYIREGEGAADTLARLATNLTAVNGALDTLGGTLLAVGQAGGDAASSLVDALGGLQAYQSAISTYYQRFYTQEERLAKTREQLAAQLGALGYAVPDTVAAYRALVNAQDLSTEAGRATYAALIGMSGAFADVAEAAQAAAAAVPSVFEALAKSINALVDGIASTRGKVAASVESINPRPAMSYAALAAAVGGASGLSAPGMTALVAANQTLAAKTAAAAAADAAKQAAQNGVNSATDTVAARKAAMAAQVQSYLDTRQRLFDSGLTYQGNRAVYFNAAGWDAPGYLRNDAYEYNASTNRFGQFGSLSENRAYTYYEHYQTVLAAVAKLRPVLDGANAALAQSEQTIAAANAALATANNKLGSAAAAAQVAQAAKAAAEVLAAKAQSDYTASLAVFASDAAKSVSTLESLREETVKYYEAQKALAEAMTTSAANLRAAVASARESQLDAATLQAKRQADYASAYSMALSTSGYTKAGYADQMTALLPSLASSLMDTASSAAEYASLTGVLFAQAETIAAQLGASAPQNYQAESLGLLDSIDTALDYLGGSTELITDAIKAGADTTAAGLREVVKALGVTKPTTGSTGSTGGTGGFVTGPGPSTGSTVAKLTAQDIYNYVMALDLSNAAVAEAEGYKVVAMAVENGLTSAQIDAVFNWPTGHTRKWAVDHGLPAFASGGYHSGGLRLVGENGPELEVTGPARIFNATQTRQMLQGGADPATAEELRALRADLRAAQLQTATLMARLVKTHEKWDGDGLPSTRSETA